MSISDHHVTTARALLKLITWRLIGKISILALLSIVLTVMWVARDALVGLAITPTKIPLLRVDSGLKNDIQNIVDKNDSIVAIQILTINFQKNIKVDTFTSIDNPVLQSIYDKANHNRIAELPLFDESVKDNNRILNLINGEFVCIPYIDHVAYKYAPEAEKYIGYVCSIGIPPSYGNFSGILTIYLRDKPDTKEDSEQIFLIARALSIRVFNDNTDFEDKKQP